jgi:hypothetical protein
MRGKYACTRKYTDKYEIVEEQTILWWCCSAFKYTETGQLESCVRCLMVRIRYWWHCLTGRPMVCKPIHHAGTHAHAVGVPTYATEHSAGWTWRSGDARCPSWRGQNVFGTYRCENRSSSWHSSNPPTFWTRRETKRYSTQQSWNHRRRLPWWDQ